MSTRHKISSYILLLISILFLLLAIFYQKFIDNYTDGLLFLNNNKNIGVVSKQSIRYTFIFINISFKTKKIIGVQTSCSCSKASLSKSVIHPFELGKISFVINVYRRMPINKSYGTYTLKKSVILFMKDNSVINDIAVWFKAYK